MPHPTCLPFAELFATFEASTTFASLHPYSNSIFSLLKRNKLNEPKIKLQICKCYKMGLNKNRHMEYFNLKILALHNVRFVFLGRTLFIGMLFDYVFIFSFIFIALKHSQNSSSDEVISNYNISILLFYS